MRKLLNTLYITNPDAVLGKDGEKIVIRVDGKEVGRRPVHILEQIVCFNYTGMSSALLTLCASHHVAVTFLNGAGPIWRQFPWPCQWKRTAASRTIPHCRYTGAGIAGGKRSYQR